MTTTTKRTPYMRDIPCQECNGEGRFDSDQGCWDTFRTRTDICEDCNGTGVVTESSHGVGDTWLPAGKHAADWQPLDVWLTTDDGIGIYAVTLGSKLDGFRGSAVGEATFDMGCVVVGDVLHGLHIPVEDVTSVVCVGTVQL